MMRKLKDPLKWLSVAAAIAATSTAEYDLAVAIHMDPVIAAAVPVALDAYVVRALAKHREVLTSVLAMVGVNAASHLVTAGVLAVEWKLITAVSAIAPLVLWRVHALGTPGEWRARKIWGEGKRARSEHAEHERVPDGVPVPDALPHPSTGPSTYLDMGTCLSPDTCPEHPHGVPVPSTPACPCEHDEDELCLCVLGCGTSCAYDLDVPDFMKERAQDTMRVLDRFPVPDDVSTLFTRDVPVTSTPTVLHLVPPLPPLPDEWTRRSTDEHTDPDTVLVLRTHEHVAAGRLHPADTPFMERARRAYTEHGGGDGILRAMKEGTGTGTPRAQRLVKACKHEHTEHEHEHTEHDTSTDGDES